MSADGGPSPAWTRRVPGSALLLFFLTTTVLTFFAVEFWNVYAMAATGSLTLLAAILPLELVYAVYYARPVWTTQVALDSAGVEAAVREVLEPNRMQPVSNPDGVLRLCSASLRVREPPCAIGWADAQPYERAGRGGPRTHVFFVGESRDVKVLASFRERVGSALARHASTA